MDADHVGAFAFDANVVQACFPNSAVHNVDGPFDGALLKMQPVHPAQAELVHIAI